MKQLKDSSNHKKHKNTNRTQLAGHPAIVLLLLLGLAATCPLTNASVARLIRRQAEPASGEQESTTQASGTQSSKPEPTGAGGAQSAGQPERLYPDLPRPPAGFLPPFGGELQPHPAYHHHPTGPAPFVAHGLRPPPLVGAHLNADQQPAPFGRHLAIPRPSSPAERLQSQSFADGLGRRLMSMIGLNVTGGQHSAAANEPPMAEQAPMQDSSSPLHNATVLQQLSKGVNSIYSGLSRMYNSTIQEQLNLLQERYKTALANSTNPWHQRMAEQMPQYFKQVANKLGEAQEQLNRVWRDVNAANASSTSSGQEQSQTRSSLSPAGWFMDNQFIPDVHGNEGFFGHQFGQVRDFWQAQVAPQIQMVRQQVGRVWQDLAASGALAPAETLMHRGRQFVNNLQGANGPKPNATSSTLVDTLFKEIESASNPEYSLIEPKSSNDEAPEAGSGAPAASLSDPSGNNGTANEHQQRPKLSLQMQNGLVNVQRELNKAWLGLTNSIQNALVHVGQSLEPRPRFATINQQQAMMSGSSAAVASEIDGKIRDLSKIQRDADMVNEAIQQQQRDTQQREQLFAGMDRFKSFFNQNFDLSRVEELPHRVGESLSRFGTVVGDLWNQVPERWDNFVSNIRPTQAPQFNAKLISTSTQASQEASGN